jgi:hypothetical protein
MGFWQLVFDHPGTSFVLLIGVAIVIEQLGKALKGLRK